MNRWIITFFGAGLLPKAPGTAGSLLATLLLAAIHLLFHPQYWTLQVILLIGLLGISALAVTLGPWAAKHYGRKDPQPFVLDEVAGICLTALFQPMKVVEAEHWWLWAAVFIAFRVFDIIKPPPASQLEKLPEGWGILMDDLAAAVYANIACQVVLRLVI